MRPQTFLGRLGLIFSFLEINIIRGVSFVLPCESFSDRIETRTPFPIDRVNCYYFHDSTPTLIDAGVTTDTSFDEVESAIKKTGGTIEGLKKIILTHAHSDQIGLVTRIVELSGAEVYIHKWDAAKRASFFLESRESSNSITFRTFPVNQFLTSSETWVTTTRGILSPGKS